MVVSEGIKKPRGLRIVRSKTETPNGSEVTHCANDLLASPKFEPLSDEHIHNKKMLELYGAVSPDKAEKEAFKRNKHKK